MDISSWRDPEDEVHTTWFKEGLTHYIALKTTHRLGFLPERELLDEFAQTAARYRSTILKE